jgi:exodeoxyribonuclease VII small subunit
MGWYSMTQANLMTTQPASFDDGLDRLETLVQKLEGGHLSLEEALLGFEEGVNLSRALQQQLADAQRRVEVLKQGLGGEYRTDPLEGDAS